MVYVLEIALFTLPCDTALNHTNLSNTPQETPLRACFYIFVDIVSVQDRMSE